MKVIYKELGIEKTLRVTEAFMEEGYRILTERSDKPKRVDSWTTDGENDIIFATEEEAENAVFEFMRKHLKLKVVESFTVYN